MFLLVFVPVISYLSKYFAIFGYCQHILSSFVTIALFTDFLCPIRVLVNQGVWCVCVFAVSSFGSDIVEWWRWSDHNVLIHQD